ncbi:MAG TPA: HEAT repeat domain-containing protein [Candidatus Acidoferrum sp.]|nr:HEAT repeat domain-containing protein [Candidatus Acidoferrum sp.]
MRLKNSLLILAISIAGLWDAAPTALAQGETAQVVNTRLETRAAGPSLMATMNEIAASADSPIWIGYDVAAVPGEHGDCCGNYRDGMNRGAKGVWYLEKEHGSDGERAHSQNELKLEGEGTLRILYRADKKHVGRIRIMSNQCQLDAGGLRLVWLKDVKSEESIAYLGKFVQGFDNSGGDEDRIGEQALTAIALHADPAADVALARFSSPGQPEELRKRASFWMGAARGAAGLAQLETMAKTDPSSEVRAQVTFALFVSKEPGATEAIIRMAREDGSPHVRGQALFWLAQKAGAKAATAISGAITNDPDTEVKKRAVFALSQMPKDEGVPKLIEVAQNNKNPEVRKQAMFWLGQSGDPRALEFFEKVLRN